MSSGAGGVRGLLAVCALASAQVSAFMAAPGLPQPRRTMGLGLGPAALPARQIAGLRADAASPRAPATGLSGLAAQARDIMTLGEIEAAARSAGFTFTQTNIGPLYRVILRVVPAPGEEGKGKAIGYTNGALTPPLLRQDTMQISFVNTGNPNSMTNEKRVSVEERGFRSNSIYGLSLLLGAYAMRWAYDNGCRRAELLAIKDNERQAKVLRRHYSRLGFRAVREVTDDISCVPDRLLWGGIGTLMEVDMELCMEKHTAEVRSLIK